MKSVNVVLFRTHYSRNIGMCARAMANMGATRLILVGPRTELNVDAKQGAAHAQSYLQDATHYTDLKEFLESEGDGLRIALSGKDFRLQESAPFDTIISEIFNDTAHASHTDARPIYLFFGPEDDGLSAEEMELCHHVCGLPIFGSITSLNISHAVLLALYICKNTERGSPKPESVANGLSETAPAYFPQKTIHAWLEALGFDLSKNRINIEKKLNRILLARYPTQDELRLLNTILQQTVRKLRGPVSSDEPTDPE